jgi:hypothetical protein
MPAKQPNRRCSCGCGRPGKYLGRLELNGQAYFLGYFATKQERSAAREAKRRELAENVEPTGQERTCESVVVEYLAEYAERRKASSFDTATCSLAPFRRQFGDRPLGSIARAEAKAWARTVPRSYVPAVVAMFNWAADEDIATANPFRGLGHKGQRPGRQGAAHRPRVQAAARRVRRAR